ncbi:hypothetical protein ACA910_021873 [Epithemia clementina (nom. ined.)]
MISSSIQSSRCSNGGVAVALAVLLIISSCSPSAAFHSSTSRAILSNGGIRNGQQKKQQQQYHVMQYPLSSCVWAAPSQLEEPPAMVKPKATIRPKRTSSSRSTTTSSSSTSSLTTSGKQQLHQQSQPTDSELLYRQRERMLIKKKLKEVELSKQQPQQQQQTDDASATSISDELKRLVTQGHASESSVIVVNNQGRQMRGRSIPAFASKRKPSDSLTNIRRRKSATATNVVASPDTAAAARVDGTSTVVEGATVEDNDTNRVGVANGPGLDRRTRGGGKSQPSMQGYPDADLQRFYRTELLTSEEEYIYGERVQFMIACEDVHEGLAIRLSRLPTMGEWAAACGYTQPMVHNNNHKNNSKNKRNNNSLIITEADEQLRPVGCEKMFEEVDPHLFSGSGLIGEAGPGRGRGRARKVPHVRVKDRRADYLIPPGSTTSSTSIFNGKDAARIGSEPVNRGTVRDFLDMLYSGREAKQTMVQNNMRLVVSIARKYMNVGVSLNDLVQEGSLGLSRAAEKFDPRMGFKFSTYASWWIQQAVFRSIAYQSRNIRLPVHIHNMLNRIHRVRIILTKNYGRAPSNEEMASHLGMSLHKYNKLLKLTKRSISLDIAKYASNPKDFGHEGEDRLADTIDASSVSGVLLDECAPERVVDHTLFLDDLNDMIQILDEDERTVLCARYGLTDGITRTVTSVAAQMKQSKAWVRSQECRALRKLRRPWYEKKLKEHESSLYSY